MAIARSSGAARALGEFLFAAVVYCPKMTFVFPIAEWPRHWPAWEQLTGRPLDHTAAAAVLATITPAAAPRAGHGRCWQQEINKVNS